MWWILGEVIAKQLARLGAKLILSARNAAELERVREQLVGMSLFQKLNLILLNPLSEVSFLLTFFFSLSGMFGTTAGKHAPAEVKILPLDLASGEDSLRVAVEKAESFFPGAGVDYMIHNAAYERPVSD